MSGPFADQPVELDPREIAESLDIYRAHRTDPDGYCHICRVESCPHRSTARARLWTGGIDPDRRDWFAEDPYGALGPSES